MKKIIILLVLIVGGFLAYNYFDSLKTEPQKILYEDILKDIEDKTVDVDTFTIYGKYLNLKGTLPSEEGSYDLVFKNDEEEIVIKTFTDTFSTSEYINDGINLEKLKRGNYLMLLHNTKTDTYYNLINKTDYHDNEYYTLSKDELNDHYLITFNEGKLYDYNYWEIKSVPTKLPDDIYDIVIDPGHGGVDTGAGNGKYNESTFNLDYAKTLKEVLEEEGFKVKMTREENVELPKYGAGSRTGIPYEVKAKLMLSIHLNSSNSRLNNGVEIYRAYSSNNTYAKVIADNIVTYANTKYSINTQNKVLDGVYMRVYSKSDIAQLTKEAKRDGYEPYEFSDHETYYFFIRETGGIMTGAFSDGRNPKLGENIYRNYNQGVEAYLVELGYISNTTDLKNIINNKEGYIKALKESVLSYAEITKEVS